MLFVDDQVVLSFLSLSFFSLVSRSMEMDMDMEMEGIDEMDDALPQKR